MLYFNLKKYKLFFQKSLRVVKSWDKTKVFPTFILSPFLLDHMDCPNSVTAL